MTRERPFIAALILLCPQACKTHDPEENTAATLEVTGAPVTKAGDTLTLESTTRNEFVKATTLQVEMHVDDATVVEYVEHKYLEGLEPAAAPTVARMNNLVIDVKDSRAGQTERIEWTFKCLKDDMSSVTYVASWWEDPPPAGQTLLQAVATEELIVARETTVVVDCTGTGAGATGSSGTDTEGTDSGTGTGMVDPPAEEPIHLYAPTDLEPVVWVYVYDDETLGPLAIPRFDLPGPASFATSANDGNAVYFGGDEITAHGRDRLTGELTPIGAPIMRSGAVGYMAPTPDDDRLFVADNNVTFSDVTQYAIGGDYGLAEGATFTVGQWPRSVVADPLGMHVYASHNQGGGGLFWGDLTDPFTAPVLASAGAEFASARNIALTPDGACLYISSGSGLSGSQIRGYSLGGDGSLTSVGTFGVGGQLTVTADDAHVVATRSGATGSVEVLPRAAGCALGEATDSIDAPLGLHGYSNVLPNGDGAIMFEFNAGGFARALRIAADGTLAAGQELAIADGVRSIVALVQE